MTTRLNLPDTFSWFVAHLDEPRLNLPDTFSWFVAHLDEPLELTIEGSSGLLFDAPCFLVGATDLYPGEVPTTLALEVEGVTPPSPGEQAMRLFLNARWMERVSVDEVRADHPPPRRRDLPVPALRPRV